MLALAISSEASAWLCSKRASKRSLSQISKTCTVASDCVGVFFGDQCSPCGCANDAVATSAKVTYDADRSAAIAACGPRPAIACGPCQDVVLKCTAGACGL